MCRYQCTLGEGTVEEVISWAFLAKLRPAGFRGRQIADRTDKNKKRKNSLASTFFRYVVTILAGIEILST